MRIGEAAKRAGVSAKAVRRYEALGLLRPRRAANGYRTFDEHDVRAIREVRALRELGIPAERSRPFLECLALGAPAADDCPSSLAEYRAAIDELTGRIEELTLRRPRLAERLREAAYRNSTADVAAATQPAAPAATPPDEAPPPVDDGAADHLPGLRVPRITLPATTGQDVRLWEPGGRTVLYIYPMTGRPDVDLPEGWNTIPGARGCTAEACGFRDHHRELVDAGATAVYGLSSQDGDYQREAAGRLGLPFAMLSDPGLELASALRLPTFHGGGNRLYTRLTLIIADGGIEHVFYPVHPPGEHAAQVLAWLRGTATAHRTPT